MKLLHIDSSITGPDSVSRELTANLVRQWRGQHPDTQVEYLDLALEAPAHLSAESLGIRMSLAESSLSEAQKRENTVTETLVSQFLDADMVVVGAPLYNFSIPSQLKAWVDRIAQAGRTFKYTESGPVGLATGKTVIIASSRGGIYSTTDAGRATEHQESYLQVIFGFFGITDIRVVRAEGIAMGEEPKANALALARREIQAIMGVPDRAAELAAA